MKRYCNYCHRRTEHIEDFNSSMCKTCGRLNHLGNVSFSGLNVKVPRLTTRVKI